MSEERFEYSGTIPNSVYREIPLSEQFDEAILNALNPTFVSNIKRLIEEYRSSVVLLSIMIATAGLATGLLIGWWLWPVQWTNITPAALDSYYMQQYTQAVTDRFAYDLNSDKLTAAMTGWESIEVMCLLAVNEQDLAERARLLYAVHIYSQGTADCFMEE